VASQEDNKMTNKMTNKINLCLQQFSYHDSSGNPWMACRSRPCWATEFKRLTQRQTHRDVPFERLPRLKKAPGRKSYRPEPRGERLQVN